MDKDSFSRVFNEEINSFNEAVSCDNGDWIVKGFIDIARNIYTISVDTKVVSKILELLLFPKLCQIARDNAFELIPCKEQNHYPDATFRTESGHLFAVDLKSTYRKSEHAVNGMTLGAFDGYFRNRNGNKNITFPYSDYSGHFVLGVIYSRDKDTSDEQKVYTLDELDKIPSVAREFKFFFQEKYRIALDRPGSGNTKNIGSVSSIEQLLNGGGPFSELGEKVFDDYWMVYETKAMASAADRPKPLYSNLREYLEFKKRPL